MRAWVLWEEVVTSVTVLTSSLALTYLVFLSEASVLSLVTAGNVSTTCLYLSALL